jgi:hypothetical protein
VSGSNGHHNGNGHAGPLPTSDGHHDRADANMLLRAIRKGWPITDEIRKRAVEWAIEQLDKPEYAETQAKAVAILQEADKHNLRLMEFLDKVKRLDAGQATENVQHTYEVEIPEARERLTRMED